jgi:hypothetical protein
MTVQEFVNIDKDLQTVQDNFYDNYLNYKFFSGLKVQM